MDVCHVRDEPWKHAKWKKSDTRKRHVLCDPFKWKCRTGKAMQMKRGYQRSEMVKLKAVAGWHLKASPRADEKHLKLTTVTVARICESPKNHRIGYFINRWIVLCCELYISKAAKTNNKNKKQWAPEQHFLGSGPRPVIVTVQLWSGTRALIFSTNDSRGGY